MDLQDRLPAEKLIDARIKELGDWRGKTLSRLRALVKEADPEVVEEWKWRGVPVWSHDGIICTGETYKTVVKMTFAKGARLKDPAGLFNPIVYLISGFRWSFYGTEDVPVGVSLAVTAAFFFLFLGIVTWIFRTGYRLKS